MEKQLRLFIAVELPAEIHMALGKIINAVKPIDSTCCKWVNPGNIHLTLKFLGNTAPATVPQLQEIIKHTAEKIPSFSISIEGTGFFPSAERPRVLWVGMDTPSPLLLLQKKLDSDLKSMGYIPEKRGFSPHLTLARFNEPVNPTTLQRINETLKKMGEGRIGIVSVDHITLFRSTLTPTGSLYTSLAKFPLSQS